MIDPEGLIVLVLVRALADGVLDVFPGGVGFPVEGELVTHHEVDQWFAVMPDGVEGGEADGHC
ncbi:hypothetical protein [Arthrobacter echini]|uniref:hypothetical protein n=1 Tax=Arthrobacter echini TaxID=1529066 RepID=UPI00292A4763|nr:hypothetical protein [Arthrobacter echini]